MIALIATSVAKSLNLPETATSSTDVRASLSRGHATHHGPNSYFVKFSNMFGECARRERMQVLPGQKLAAPLVLLREILLLSSVESKKGARHPAVEESRPACRVKEDGRIRIIDGYDQKNNRVWNQRPCVCL